MAELERVRQRAKALIAVHLDPVPWSFAFDHAKRRAGLCNYTTRRITLSRHLAVRMTDDEVHQVLLHEIAHALAGPGAGHGPRWKRIARDIGYVGERVWTEPVGDDLAPWVGTCPAGHAHYRHKRPTRPLACGRCARKFDPANAIAWERRTVSAAALRQGSVGY